jgi:pyruvate formate lyase activating enzyme
VPLHFSAFHPDFKMLDVPATPVATLVRARNIALMAGLHYVYTGNVHNIEGDTTFCPDCQAPLIVRDWYLIKKYRLTVDGHCPDCGAPVAGRFASKSEHFGRQRIPVTIMQ